MDPRKAAITIRDLLVMKSGLAWDEERDCSIETGKAVELLEGPVCNNSLQWWKVRVAENGLVGWVSEGDYLTPEGYHESSWLIPCESKENCGTP
jgi:CubicO group peptidase (beta-lactamase class C family)